MHTDPSSDVIERRLTNVLPPEALEDHAEAVEAYALSESMGDVVGIVGAMGLDDVRLVGHDWGAALAWLLAAYHSDRVERLAALSVGAPGGRPPDIEQRRRSWYMYFFQFEGAAETWLRHDDWKFFREWTGGDGDVERYIQDLSRPGALTSALNWYRANVRPEPPGEGDTDFPGVSCPTLGVWIDGDSYLTEDGMAESGERVDGPWRYERMTDASHWLMLDRPAETNRILVEFLTE